MSCTAGYIPALRFHGLTRLYDPLIRLVLREERFKRKLVERAAIRPGHRVLDLGCGTGTLTLLIAGAASGVNVVGLDRDPEILRLALRKAVGAGTRVGWALATAPLPPFRPGSFDRVLSSLLFHHLTTAEKQRTFAAIRALLTPGGELHVADWSRGHNVWMRAIAFGARFFDGFETTRDNARGRLLPLMQDAGLLDPHETHHEATPFGTLAFFTAKAPA